MEKDQMILLGARAESFIQEHLSEKLDRNTICRALSTNRTTLSRALMLRTGKTLQRFILDERIRRSKTMLLTGKLSIEKIAERCGFSSAEYFSRIFREQVGMTPAAFMKKELERNEPLQIYRLDKGPMPSLPCLHDCAVSHIEADGEFLSICFNDSISLYNSISSFHCGSTKLTVRFHLTDSSFIVYSSFKRGTYAETDWESGYSPCDDVEIFLKEAPALDLYYTLHCVEYNHVILKLWSHKEPREFLLDLTADRVEYEWCSASSGSAIVDRMKTAGVKFQTGLSDEEIANAERAFGFTFPKEIAGFLRTAVPTGEQFFDYRDLSERNAEKFRAFYRRIEAGFAFDLSNNQTYFYAMKRKYHTVGAKETLEAVMRDYARSPKLIPFYAHRCFFDGLDGMPVLSYAGPLDTIVYGENFEDYLEREFCRDANARQTEIPKSIEKTGIWAWCVKTAPYVTAHSHCTNNKGELELSQTCGCFYCLKIFTPQKIDRYIDDGKTALCPFCGIDSILPDVSGYAVTKSFLQEMSDYWFSPNDSEP